MNNQELIGKFYSESVKGIDGEWFVSNSQQWYSYIINLPQNLQTTYLIVVLENQVLNGGFHQCFVNGYGQFAKETIDVLIEIRAFQRANLLNKAFILIKDENISDEEFRKGLLNGTIERLFDYDNLFKLLNELDGVYYDIEDEDVEYLLANYLRKVS
ncbi:DMP19 family protein [Elizabethkingia miricola]|uniref:DMP19 family protein n=1 Tax=Elizabethkingia miricola TaxID=172045 RepID=UPI0009CAF105|nr:DUF4375 domain-containing protein [Elizabethkingia miricola]OPC16793.1 hypothetical protein BAY01_03595 [Elizabethkingia miricola]